MPANQYRLYVDESGNHHYSESLSLAERYLCLTGIIIKQDIYIKQIHPQIEQLRSLFYEDLDNKPCLHLDDIRNFKRVFIKLKDNSIQEKFNQAYLDLLTQSQYTVVAVVFDKKKHQDKLANIEPLHPYHEAFMYLLNQYYIFLTNAEATGDVFTESRGAREDKALETVFNKFSQRQLMANSQLINAEITLKTKLDLICGLELADLLALPCKIDILCTWGQLETYNNFTQKVIDTIQVHYHRDSLSGRIHGFGKQLIF